MKLYDAKHIKNIALLGAPKSGKTSLAEDMVFEAGITHRRGNVEAKNTVSDYHEIEHEKGNSVFTSLMHTEWQDYKINILDTPGFEDFAGEIVSALRVADTCLITINAQHGVEIGTELIWHYVQQYNKPLLFVINQVDHPKSDFEKALQSLREQYGKAVVQVQYPVNEGEGFNGIIDLLRMQYYKFNADGGKPEKLPIPERELEKANRLHNELVEKAAENDEQLMERYFAQGTLTEDEMKQGLKLGMIHHDLFPVFVASAKKNMGSGRIMGFIDNVAPSPTEAAPEILTDLTTITIESEQPLCLFVFKTHFEPNLGKISYFKIITGELQPNTELVNTQTGQVEKIHQLFIVDGKNRQAVEKLTAGDIGATLKLKDTYTNQTLCDSKKRVALQPIAFPQPRIRMAVVAASKQDDDKIGEVLQKIHAEDPTLHAYFSNELKQLILEAQGEQHLAVCKWYMENVYHLKTEFVSPKISYRETIRKPATAVYRHKKQSGGAGQFAEVHMRIEPLLPNMPEPTDLPVRGKEIIELPWGGQLAFYNCIVGGVIDARFIPSVLKGVMEKMEQGPVSGSYVRDIRVLLFDGKMHAVDSNDISFKIAGMRAFKEAFLQAEPQLLEPIMDVEVWAPEEYVGDVLADLQTRRSIIMGIEAQGAYQVVKTRTPLAALDKYTTALRSITQGKARFAQTFADYAPVPFDVQNKIAKELQLVEAE
ncbi:MAG: elongation factor G [Cyclobacteriaceae bacterium]|jgi:elongation factor G|nr:elongation factor G [Cyclobacteriaceae bacterium]